MARPSPANQPTYLPSMWLIPPNLDFSFLAILLKKKNLIHFKTKGTKHVPLPLSWILRFVPMIGEGWLGTPSISSPIFFCSRTLISIPHPYQLQSSEGSGMVRDPERAVYIINIYIYFSFMVKLGGEGRQVVKTKGLPILLSPIAAPGPSPSLHRKQSVTRVSTLLFSSVALLT